jgi:translation initiation factor IF-1
VFCYVGSVFSPALDEGVGNLWTVSGRMRVGRVWIGSELTGDAVF